MPQTAQPARNAVNWSTAVAYLVAIALGIANGLWGTDLTLAVSDFISTVFIRCFKFVSIPIIAVSIIATLATISQSSESGKIFRHTIFYTLFTTILAASVAALLYLFFAPANISASGAAAPASIAGRSYMDYVQTVIPDNILAPFLSANVLSVLLVSALVGIAIAKLPATSEPRNAILNFFKGAQAVLFVIVGWLIRILPIGIFGFISQLVIEMVSGVEIGGLGSYFATVITANFVQMLLVLPALLLLRGLNPIRVAKGMAPALAVAFFSKSSAGTLPVTMACSENNVGVRSPVARFVLPICTTINMNGCAAFIFVTVIFLMQNAGIDISATTMLTWIVIATVAAVGNAGVPMGCFFLSASLLASMDVPIHLMGVILPVYAVIDMIETTLNVWSDSCVAACVNKDLYGE
ncbi:MAG TPA: dicarboxylate/amino acid:cation symporter [Sutterella sp.]|nr:dicarboxylate/amino acid:cation symporter [Sutterella sp.]